MKIAAISGFSKSGKTTTAVNLIKELIQRGYKVIAIKDIHAENFKMDTSGSNTHRLMEAGSDMVVARGLYETDFLIPRKIELFDIIEKTDCDYLVIEGAHDETLPRILTAKTVQDLDERMDEHVFAISGVISNELDEYNGIKCLNSLTGITELTDYVEANALKWGETVYVNQFKSKKNSVYLVEDNGTQYVVKGFSDNRAFHNEIYVSAVLRDNHINSPQIVRLSDNSVTYEYIEGILLIDILERGCFKEFEHSMQLLVNWLKDFYYCMKNTTGSIWIHNDAQLRNFMLSEKNGDIYGLDFEGCGPGRIEEDIAGIFLFCATYSPCFSNERLDQSLCFIENAAIFEMERNVFFEKLEYLWEEMKKRRAYCLNMQIPETLIMGAAKIFAIN